MLYNINMLNIVNGPSREALTDSFVRRLPIVVEVTTGKKHRMLLLSKLEHEDGSGYKFTFQTALKRVTGYYDAQKREGHINVP
jgi:hypothetical protein